MKRTWMSCLQVFEESAHSPMFEEPETFDAVVIDFVEGFGD